MTTGSRQRGFTLLEVIVALAVIAFALSAAVSAVSGNTRNAAGLQQRTYAHWVAMNQKGFDHPGQECAPRGHLCACR